LGGATFMLKINRVHHIAIICSDYERSKHFYTQILGFKILQEVYRAERKSYKLDLEVGNQYQIELFSFPDPVKRPSRPEAAGLRHLAFEVNNIEEAVAAITADDVIVEPIRIDEFTGKKFTFFTDPDGLPIEFYER
jgi:glyoxylase I family protein